MCTPPVSLTVARSAHSSADRVFIHILGFRADTEYEQKTRQGAARNPQSECDAMAPVSNMQETKGFIVPLGLLCSANHQSATK